MASSAHSPTSMTRGTASVRPSVLPPPFNRRPPLCLLTCARPPTGPAELRGGGTTTTTVAAPLPYRHKQAPWPSLPRTPPPPHPHPPEAVKPDTTAHCRPCPCGWRSLAWVGGLLVLLVGSANRTPPLPPSGPRGMRALALAPAPAQQRTWQGCIHAVFSACRRIASTSRSRSSRLVMTGCTTRRTGIGWHA